MSEALQKRPTMIELLRSRTTQNYISPGKYADVADPLCQFAAEEIDRLRQALSDIAYHTSPHQMQYQKDVLQLIADVHATATVATANV